ncbi:N-(5-amino-5-carboxypentanoyl)-L-cysteinyl-D-valine synthase [Clarias magur]|uniref:N-(5-amino-5-carboxypentanoyl)-L-cysteinyl-D-valine synthase n=1 Tax=Clarias magur TaxID=1594786 RepID=A0A8J4TGT8_CLAMG|nr:N-(5-amino-5-carboxypentanoyl)-L-cysteinyl-D-valine synthase [Clarias magur]
MVVPDNHPGKRRAGENDLFKRGGDSAISSHSFPYCHSAAGCVYPCGIVFMPFALECTHVSLLRSLPRHISVSEKGQKGKLWLTLAAMNLANRFYEHGPLHAANSSVLSLRGAGKGDS